MNPQKLHDHLGAHAYTRLFVDELGWSNSAGPTREPQIICSLGLT